MSDDANFFSDPIFQNIISEVIFFSLIWGLRKCADISSFIVNPKWHRMRLASVVGLWAVANGLYVFFNLGYMPIFIFITSCIVILFFWKETAQFSNGGLLRLDRTIANGFNYGKSLKLCKNQLDFLGIGASKLTSDPEFEKAIRRCNRPTTPIRFLLSKPDNQLLTDAAKQKGVDPNEYQRRVTDSLQILAHLKNDLKMNIAVKFYRSDRSRDMPLYRLMFIDSSICLVSYNVFGEGDGSQLPQLHVKRFDNRRDVESFYYPFLLYFESLWNDATQWDFKFPIT